MLVPFASVLTPPYEHHRRAKEARIAYEAARVPYGTGSACQHFEILFWLQVRQRP